ncbi:MAG: hypothetical protein JWQ59_1425, partial [Cryobacterium sp.]|nr:hypothetical protein [Cryobacterium sp.]
MTVMPPSESGERLPKSRLRRWEQRNQERFEKSEANYQRDQREHAERNKAAADPSGRQYEVRAVRKGESLRTGGQLFFLGVWELVVALVVLAAGALVRETRVRSSRGFVVGVVHEGPFLIRVVHREDVESEAELSSKVIELAQRVERGEFARS